MSTRNNETMLERYTRAKGKLEDTAYNQHNHILDRIDAFLELAQITQRSTHQAWTYIREARDLIREEFDRAR